MAQVSGLRRDKERERERRAKAAKMRTLIAQARAIWILHGSCYLATPKKQGKHRKERKRGGGLRHLVGWQDGAETHHLEGRMSEGVGEEDELGQIDGAGRGGTWERAQKEQGRERGPGRTSSHCTFLSHLAFIPILHDAWLPPFLSPETAWSRSSRCCLCEFRWTGRQGWYWAKTSVDELLSSDYALAIWR